MTIDLEATRARIRNAPTDMAKAMSQGYRDNDIARTRAKEASRPARPFKEASNATQEISADADGFIDLDNAPLMFPGDAELTSTPDLRPEAPPETPPPAPREEAPEALALDPARMRRIIFLATSLPGSTPPFGKAQPNLTGEGLRFGLGRFTQLSGDLGRLLLAMQDVDAPAFAQAFGPGDDLPEASAADLLRVTTALVPSGASAQTAPNMQPVAGKELWAPEWVARFKATAGHRAFQDAQYYTAAQTVLLPMLDFARAMGLDSEKGLTLLTERAIQLGVSSAQDFVATACGPLSTDALKREALVFLSSDPNDATLSAFQAAHALPDTNRRLDALSHAALFAALRARANPPIMLPSHAMMLDQIVSAAASGPVPGLLADIRNNPKLSDAPLSDADPVMEHLNR